MRYLHLSSYFLVFRRPVLDDPGFRWRLDHVAGQVDKMLVIHKYEVGISRYLTDSGFDFDTFIPSSTPSTRSTPGTSSSWSSAASRWSSATSWPRTRATCRAWSSGPSGSALLPHLHLAPSGPTSTG